jgi:hypothetical protein
MSRNELDRFHLDSRRALGGLFFRQTQSETTQTPNGSVRVQNVFDRRLFRLIEQSRSADLPDPDDIRIKVVQSILEYEREVSDWNIAGVALAKKMNEFISDLPDQMPVGYLVIPTQITESLALKDSILEAQMPLSPNISFRNWAGINASLAADYNKIIQKFVTKNTFITLGDIRQSNSVEDLTKIRGVGIKSATFMAEAVKRRP